MRLPAEIPAAFVLVPRVPARAPAFHARVLVQGEVSAKREFPKESPSTTQGSSGTLHLPRSRRVRGHVASASRPTQRSRSHGDKR